MGEGCCEAHIPSSQERERHGVEGIWLSKVIDKIIDKSSYRFPLTKLDFNVPN